MLPDRIAQMDEAIRKIPGLVDLVQRSLHRQQLRRNDTHRPSLAPGASALWLNCLSHNPETPRTRVPHDRYCMGLNLAVHESCADPDCWSTFWQVPIVNAGHPRPPKNALRILLGSEVTALQALHDEFATLDTRVRAVVAAA